MNHEALAKSFLNAGEDYDRYRPGFPEDAASTIVPHRVGGVLDLGAGTGKFTELLLDRAERITAVEPSERMLEVLRRKLPSVEAIVGSAESIPLADASVDVVTVAQAFHWFDVDAACAELGRVLVPEGVLGLLWNHSDPACAWDRACYRIAHPAVVDETAMTSTAAEELPGFAFVERAAVPWLESITRADYVRRWLTVSSFITATPEERRRMVAEVETVLDEHEDTRGRTVLQLPQVTDVFVYRRSQ